MILKQPVAQIDSEIDLVGFRYVELTVAFVLHEYSDELVAYLRGVLGGLSQTELFFLHLLLEFWLLL